MNITFTIITTENNTYLTKVSYLFKAYQQELNEDLCFQSFEDELNNPLTKYAPPKGALIAALHKGDAIGCVALQALPDSSCEMKRLYVLPNYRAFKIGEALVDEIIKVAIQLEYATMRLDTLQKLQPAIKLYEKKGFIHTNAYYNNPLKNVVFMEKQLVNI